MNLTWYLDQIGYKWKGEKKLTNYGFIPRFHDCGWNSP